MDEVGECLEVQWQARASYTEQADGRLSKSPAEDGVSQVAKSERAVVHHRAAYR